MRGIALEDLGTETAVRAVVLVLASKAPAVREVLGPMRDMLVLQVASVPDQLSPWFPMPPGILVGICSRYAEFLKITRTVLISAGLDPMGLVPRDARGKNWQRGLGAMAAVVCDVIVARRLPRGAKGITVRILAQASIADLRELQTSIGTRLDRTSSQGAV